MWEPAAQGKITRWNQVNPAWPDQPIKLFGAGSDSGTFDYFTEAIVGKAKSSRGDFTASEDDNVLVQGVAGDVNAIGYFGYAYYAENQNKLKALPIVEKDGKPAVSPSEATVINGTYQPLARPIFIYVNAKAIAKPEVKKFVDFYMANASKMAKEVKYVPLPADAYKTAARPHRQGQEGHRVRRQERSRHHDLRPAQARSLAVIAPREASLRGCHLRAGLLVFRTHFSSKTTMRAVTTPERIVSSVPMTGAARLAELARMKADRKRKDKIIETVLLLAACVSVFTTLAIVYILVKESVVFFSHVPLWTFLTDKQWTPAVRRRALRHRRPAVGHAQQFAGGAGHRHPARAPSSRSTCRSSPATTPVRCSSRCWNCSPAFRPSSTASSRCWWSRR